MGPNFFNQKEKKNPNTHFSIDTNHKTSYLEKLLTEHMIFNSSNISWSFLSKDSNIHAFMKGQSLAGSVNGGFGNILFLGYEWVW